MMKLHIALGANIGDREATMKQALQRLSLRIGSLCAVSSYHETHPVGFESAHLFLNAVAEFDTALAPRQLLEATQEVERELGRTAKSTGGAYADRTIDIDLLLLGDTVVEEPGLVLPHPRMAQRRFVLEPMAEIAPDAVNPVTGMTVREMLARLSPPEVREEHAASAALLDDINALLPQLSESATQLTGGGLQEMLNTEGTRLFTLRDGEGNCCGMATLCRCASPTGVKMWVEDVVVDSRCRGMGYARHLMECLKKEAEQAGAKALLLTSRPSRVAANALYRKSGFEQRTTNVYRYVPKRP